MTTHSPTEIGSRGVWVLDPANQPRHYDHWPKHPEWRGRYDFLTATPPPLASTYHAESTSYRASAVPLLRYHFDAFHWGHGHSCTTTRADIDNALHNVLSLFDIVADMYLTQALIVSLDFYKYPDEEFIRDFDDLVQKIQWYLYILHAVVVHVSAEVHSLADLEGRRVVPPAWQPYSRDVTLSPELLDDAKKPSLPRPPDDYVFRLCRLFAERPSFSDALDEALTKAREQCDFVGEWVMQTGRSRQPPCDLFIGFKRRRSKCMEIAYPYNGDVLDFLAFTPVLYAKVCAYWPFAEQPATHAAQNSQTLTD